MCISGAIGGDSGALLLWSVVSRIEGSHVPASLPSTRGDPYEGLNCGRALAKLTN